ncbi:MAG: hypothetical protein DWQ36_09810 [Acidobacteria bacterium]|nr:MAG: hypothetical protein DWQ30_01090 [Acidobacteriota bacterium]REK08356.1 MAG: hypothetical protein DWQ36_09810 [Acidobacteriota bacterium]
MSDAATGAHGSPVGHRVIRADAGTGKTYSLTIHFLRLVASGVDPGRIVAVTFTRKAAGEILERVLLRLAEAVLDASAARRLEREVAADVPPAALRQPEVRSRPDCESALAATWLELLVRNLPRLQISTLDGFFLRLVSGFRFEMGLGRLDRVGAATDPALEPLRRSTVERMLHEERGRDGLEALSDLVSRLYRGDAARSVSRSLDLVVRELDALYREAPGRETWSGVPEPYRRISDEELERYCSEVERRVREGGTGNKRFDVALSALVDALRSGSWQAAITGKLADWYTVGAALTYHNRSLPQSLAEPLAPLFEHAAAMVLREQNLRTAATHDVLRCFTELWSEALRRRGFALFDELVERSGSFLTAAGPGAAERASGELEASELALRLLYRLDMQVEHLLLDEFQDTSRAQWKALAPLADELLAWGDGSRTLWAVGDPKQAIYGWRGGCVELFDELEERVAAAGGTSGELSKSYRSAPQVVAAVNRVFGGFDPSMLGEALCPAARRWLERFRQHTTERGELPGAVVLRTTGAWEGVFEDGDDLLDGVEQVSAEDEGPEIGRPQAHLQTAASRIRDLLRDEPGLSIGVLTVTNRTAAEMVQRLRRLGVAASGEGGSSLDDEPVVLAVLAALRLGEHPGDLTSSFFLAKTAVAGAVAEDVGLETEEWRAPLEASRRVRELFAALGPARLVARWKLLLEGAGGLSTRSQRRLQQLLEVAESFEEEPQDGLGELVEYALAATLEEPEVSGVRVMTVHKAKGLEFDRVVLCELERDIALLRNPMVNVERPLPTAPPSAVHRATNQNVRALSEPLRVAHAQELERRLFDDLSLLYVALTRARRELHLLVQPLEDRGERTREGRTFAALLRQTLCPESTLAERAEPDRVLFVDGESATRGEVPAQAAASPAAGEAPAESTSRAAADDGPAPSAEDSHRRAAAGQQRAPRPTIRPSQLLDGPPPGARELLQLRPSDGALRGSVLHAWLARCLWLEPTATPTSEWPLLPAQRREAIERLSARPSPAQEARWWEELVMALRLPAVQRIFVPPEKRRGERVELWTERSFAALRPQSGDGVSRELVRGTFDRVELVHQAGRPAAARVIDFKTDRLSGEQARDELVRRATPQLLAYREALAAMLQLLPTHVRAEVVLLDRGEVVAVG